MSDRKLTEIKSCVQQTPEKMKKTNEVMEKINYLFTLKNSIDNSLVTIEENLLGIEYEDKYDDLISSNGFFDHILQRLNCLIRDFEEINTRISHIEENV